MGYPETLPVLIAKLRGGLMDRWNRVVHFIPSEKLLSGTWSSGFHQIFRRRNSSNESFLFSRKALHEYTKLVKVSPCVSQEIEELLHHAQMVASSIMSYLLMIEAVSWRKAQVELWLLCRYFTKTYRGTSKVRLGNHDGYKAKNKRSPAGKATASWNVVHLHFLVLMWVCGAW